MSFEEQEIYPLLALVLRFHREHELRLNQHTVAARAGLSQSVVSMWENATTRERAPGRESLKRLVTRGLRFPYEEADAILWLAQSLRPDGSGSLTAGELRDNIENVYDPTVVLRLRDPEEYCRILMDMLRRTEQRLRPTASVEVFQADAEGRLAFERALLEMDEAEAPRMTVSSFPPSFALPWEIRERTQMELFRDNPAVGREILLLKKARYESWRSWVDKRKSKTIVEKAGIERYFREAKEGKSPLAREDAKKQGQQWIAQLSENEKSYSVRVKDSPIVLGYVLVGGVGVMLFGTNAPQTLPYSTGIRGIRVIDPAVVLRFRLEFEREWEAPETNKDRMQVIEWLSRLME